MARREDVAMTRLLALGASVVCCGVAVCVAALLLHPAVLDEALA